MYILYDRSIASFSATLSHCARLRRFLPFILLVAGLCFCLNKTEAQTIIWSENFSGPNQGWTIDSTNCDATGWFRVRNGRFEIRDMEGAPCCGASTGGKNNSWTTDPIDIAGRCNVSIRIEYGDASIPAGILTVDSIQPSPNGPFFGCQGDFSLPNGIDGTHDQIVFEYSLDGGPWILFEYVFGDRAKRGIYGTAVIGGLSGATLRIRIRPATSAQNEIYWFDNVRVTSTPTSIPPPTNTSQGSFCIGSPVQLTASVGTAQTVDWFLQSTGGQPIQANSTSFNVPNAALPGVGQPVTYYAESVNTATGARSCTRTPVTFTMLAPPTVNYRDTIPLCANSTATFDPFPPPASGVTYTWRKLDMVDIGLTATTGTGNIPTFPVADVAVPTVSLFSVTPSIGACDGKPDTFRVVVYPQPLVSGTATCVNPRTSLLYFIDVTSDAANLTATGIGSLPVTPNGVGRFRINNISTTVNSVRVIAATGSCSKDISIPAPECACPNNAVTPPVPGAAPPPVCAGTPVGNLTATAGAGLAIDWYADATGTTALRQGSNTFSPGAVPATTTFYMAARDTATGCQSVRIPTEVTISPVPTMSPVANQQACVGLPVTIPAFQPTNISYTWTNDNTATGLAASDIGNIQIFNALAAGTSRITVTPAQNSCTGTPVTFTLTVGAAPTLTLSGGTCSAIPSNTYIVTATTNGTSVRVVNASGVTVTGTAPTFTITIPTSQNNLDIEATNAAGCIAPQRTGAAPNCTCPTVTAPVNPGNPSAICVGSPTPTLTVTSTNPVEWFATATGGTAIGTGNSFTPTGTLTTTTTFYAEALITGTSCRSTTRTAVTVTVTAAPTMNVIRDTAFCAGSAVDGILFTSPQAGTTFRWTNNQPSIGLGPSGTNSIGPFTMSSGANVTATITVIPALNGCDGPQRTFTIGTNQVPTLTLAPAECLSRPGTQYRVNVTTNSTSVTSVPAGTVTPATGGFLVNNLPTGTNAVITAINAAGCRAQQTANSPNCDCPSLNPPRLATGTQPTVTVCAGTAMPTLTVAVDTGQTANWYTQPTGAGTLIQANSLTFTPASITTTYYVEAVNILTRCVSSTRTAISVQVNAVPVVNPVRDTTVCRGSSIGPIVLSSTPGGGAISWTNNNTAIGLEASGNNNIPFFNAADVATRQNATITVIARVNNCPSQPRTFNINVEPNPELTVSAPVCTAIPSTTFSVTVTTTGTTITTTAGTITGNAPNFTVSNIPIAALPVTIRATGINDQCWRSSTLTIPPTCDCPTVAAPVFSGTPPTVCVGAPLPNLTVATATGTTVDWYSTATGGTPVTSGSLTFTPTTGLPVGTTTFYAEARNTANNCRSATRTAIAITVIALPQMTRPRDTVLCAGSVVRLPNFSGTAGATYTWTNSNTTIGLAANGTNNIPQFNATNVTTRQTATIRVTPAIGACTGAIETFTITVEPQPVFTIAPATCPGRPSTTYNVSVTLGLGVSVNSSAGTLTTTGTTFNYRNIPIDTSVRITISNTGCRIVQTITPPNCSCPNVAPPANPSNPTICSGVPLPVLSARADAGQAIDWYATATGGTALARDTARFAPPAGTTTTTTFYAEARDRATGCVSATRTAVVLTINPTPTFTALPDLSLCSGDSTSAITFTGTPGTTYAWRNSNPTIGLQASGTGNIPAYRTPVVTTNTNATIIVTPTLGTCVGRPDTFLVTLNGRPALGVSLGDCAPNLRSYTIRVTGGGTVTATSGTVSTTGGIVSVTNIPVGTNPLVTLSNGGCIASQVVNSPACSCPAIAAPTQPVNQTICLGANTPALRVNVGTNQTADWYTTPTGGNFLQRGTTAFTFTTTIQTAGVYTVYAEARDTVNDCRSSERVAVVLTVNAPPDLVRPTDRATCGGDSISTVRFSGFVGATFTWTNNNPRIGLPATGTGDIQAFLTNNADTLQNARITVTPSANGCTGNAQFFNIRVNPAPVVDSIPARRICTGSTLPINFTSRTPNVQFDWTNNSDSIGIPRSGMGNRIDINTNNILTNQFASLTVRATTNGCTGPFRRFTVAVGARNTVSTIENTCRSSLAGTQRTDTLKNISGCDSIVLRRFVFDPTLVDTTDTERNTCDPTQVGTSFQNLRGSDGCDSIVRIRNILRTSAVNNIAETTCDPTKAGTFRTSLINRFGCDSVIIRQITFDPRRIDTVPQQRIVCDPSQAGVVARRLTGSDGCDSIVIVTSVFRVPDTTRLTQITCDPANNNMVTRLPLRNRFGCDSLVLTTFRFDPRQIDTTRLRSLTCDPAQVANPRVVRINRPNRCDSVVVTTFTLARRDSIVLRRPTCKPGEVGTFRDRFQNQFGCDSIVVRINIFEPRLIDTVRVRAATCDSTLVGVTSRILQGSDGCDSVVVTTTSFNPINCPPVLRVTDDSTRCASGTTGTLRVNVIGGPPPYQYSWNSNTGNSGNGQSATNPVQIANLPPGTYTVAVTTAVGQINTAIGRVRAPVPISIRLFNPRPAGTTDLRCNGDATGNIRAAVSGGNPGYTLRWSTGATADSISQLLGGTYTVTVTDQNNCTEVASRRITEPLPLDPGISIQPFVCGIEAIDAVLQPRGGQRPYSVTVNGNPQTNLRPSLTPGDNRVSVIDSRGCRRDTVVFIKTPVVPVVVLPPDTIIRPGTSLVVQAQTNLQGWTRLEWKPNAILTGRTLQQSFTPEQTISVIVTLTDSAGCAVRDTMLVVVQNKVNLYLPNIFTPDGDGINDRFEVGADRTVSKLNKVAIFTRWGDMVYLLDEPTDVADWAGWDGSAHGRPAPPGVYVYYFSVLMSNGETVLIEGDVTLMR
jgi:gliding motility-associated-like protein